MIAAVDVPNSGLWLLGVGLVAAGVVLIFRALCRGLADVGDGADGT